MSGGKKQYGQVGRKDCLFYKPEDLKIITDPKHALYDPRVELPLDENLVLNIMVRGVKVAILARHDGGKMEVVDGRQRVRCAIEANKRLKAAGSPEITVPVIIERGADQDIFSVMIATNEHRQADGPVAKARKFSRLMDMGVTKKAACIEFGVSTVTGDNWLLLLNCDKKVQDAVDAGKASAEVAQILSKLPREEQVAKLDEMIAQGVARGSKGKRAAENAVGKTVRQHVRSVKEINAVLEILNAAGADEKLPDPKKLLKWVLGDDSAIAKKWRGEA